MDIGAIVKDCQNGSREAFGFLYQTYSLPMMGVIGYYVHNQEIVKDILHDGFIIAFTSIGTLKDVSKIESWLTTIMKNLSLQYLRKEAEHISIPMSDTAIPEQLAESQEETDLSWEQLEAIIRQLPDGYGAVFRLNVLQGLSHKEIAKFLGISHLTSASQLHHAKAMLRRMIYQYRMEMGILSIIVAIAFAVYDFIVNRSFQEKAYSVDSNNTLLGNNAVHEPIAVNCDSAKINNNATVISSTNMQAHLVSDKDIKTKETPNNTTIIESNDSLTSDTITVVPTINSTEIYLANATPKNHIKSSNKEDWTFSLAYSGTIGQDNRLTQHIPDISSGIPGQEMEEHKRTKHYMPVTVGLSISKSISSRWSLESGLRYTYLRTDILTENKYNVSETVQKIHYIGIPLKFSYKVFKTNRFSIYGQAGFVLDIPVNGTSSTFEYNFNEKAPYINKSRIEMTLQWSVEGGVGVQYQFTPTISIYAEPSFNYYFKSGTGININTIRQDKPFELTIPIGIRMTW